MREYETELNAFSVYITFIFAERLVAMSARCNGESCDFSTIFTLNVNYNREEFGDLSSQ